MRLQALRDDATLDGDVGDAAGVVFCDGGTPHICDSVVLTNLRFGLPGLHIFAFCSGVICCFDG